MKSDLNPRLHYVIVKFSELPSQAKLRWEAENWIKNFNERYARSEEGLGYSRAIPQDDYVGIPYNVFCKIFTQ